jgi:hypothetical protein
MLNIINYAALCRFSSLGAVWTIFLQWLREEEKGFHGALATKLIKEALPCKQECQSEGAEHIYLIFVM